MTQPQELKIQLKFKEASEILYFHQRLQKLIAQAQPKDVSQILAAHVLNDFLRKRNLFFAYPRPQASITLDTSVCVAIFALSNLESDFYFQNIRNETDQKLLA